MALVLADRVLETTSVAGTGDAALNGAVTGYQPFSTIGNGNTTYYTIVAVDDNLIPTGDWEVGIGTYITAGNKISRDTVLSSSNGGAKVYFASGTKQVFLDLPSEEVLLTAGNVYGPASAVNSNFALYDGTTGKLLKDAGINASTFATAAQGAKADTAVQPGSLGTAAYLNAGSANGVATLDSGGKVPTSQIPQMGDLNYQGTWNATTNTPTLVSSSGTKGYYYVVSVAGSTNLNGITDWQIGDWAVFNGSVWQKIDNTDLVTSVNGQTGTVVITLSGLGAGTIATQNANAVAITGGAIDGTTVGATTPSTGAFTYLSTNSTTSTTPTLSFNGSNSNYAGGATVAGNYLQNLLQNKSGTAGASTNYVLSNDLGTDSTYYGEFGMNSSVYSSGTPADFFSLNNGVYFSAHDGDVTIGSGNGYKTYFAWGTAGQSAHVINTSGAIGLNTSITGSTNFGTANQFMQSAGSTATPVWSSTLSGATINNTNTITVKGSSFTLQDTTDTTKQANFDLSGLTTGTTYSYTLPAVTGTLATLGNISQTFAGATTFSNTALTFGNSTSTSTVNISNGAIASGSTATLNIGAGGLTGSTTSITIGGGTGNVTTTMGGAVTATGNVSFNGGGATTTTIGNTSTTGTITLGRSTVSQTTNIQAGATASGSTKTLNIGTGGLTGSTTAIAIGSTFGTSVTANGAWSFSTPLVATNMVQSTTSTSGYLSSTDWNTFNSKYSTGGALGTPSSGTLTNCTGLPVGGISATGTPSSTTYLRGDGTWSTVSAIGVTSVTGTAPIAVSTTLGVANVSISQATTSTNGYLSSTDWNTFNGKGSGTVTSASVVSANGFAGTVATATTTPAITLSTTITGVIKGNGTAISAATSGTDYAPGTSALATGILKSTTTTGALSIAVAADFPTLNQNTTGTASNVTGIVAIANGGTNSTATPTSGGVGYGTGTAYGYTAAGTSGQVLKSNGSSAPTWASYTNPTQTIFKSGSGTYTTPSGAKYLKIRMVGGGGGGGGNGSSNTAGSAGGTTTFNSVNANGGSGGNGGASGNGTPGGAGGTGGTGTASFRSPGQYGVSGNVAWINASYSATSGGGGSSVLGGGALGATQGSITAFNAAANSGGGGGGAGGVYGSTNSTPGAGGGEYVELYISAPSATYSYAVGAGGSGGTGSGGNSASGGNGGSGVIIIEEYYAY